VPKWRIAPVELEKLLKKFPKTFSPDDKDSNTGSVFVGSEETCIVPDGSGDPLRPKVGYERRWVEAGQYYGTHTTFKYEGGSLQVIFPHTHMTCEEKAVKRIVSLIDVELPGRRSQP
jgi:hypothetical protein